MIKSIILRYKQIAGKLEYRSVLKNFSFLSVVNIGNYVMPLLTLPYLVNVLGAESFGLVMFAQALTQYFIAIVDYGFNFSATREIALNKNNAAKVSEIFCAVLLLKTLLCFLSVIILIVVVFSVERFSSFPAIYFLSFITVLGNVLFPTWFFQGLEKMKYITLVNLSSKISSTIFIFIFIHNPEHILLVPLIYGISSIVPSVISLLYVPKLLPLALVLPSYKMLVSQLRSGKFVFFASISSSLYSVSNTFLLGFLFNNTYAGYYSFAEKIIRACTSLFIPLNNALYPYMSIKMQDSPYDGWRIIRKIMFTIIFIATLGSLFIYFGSNFLVLIVKEEFYPSIVVLKILSPLLIIVAVTNLIGFQILFTTGLEKKYLLSTIIAGLLNLLFCFILSPILLYQSAAVSLLIAEVYIAGSFLFYARKFVFSQVKKGS